MKPSMEMDAPMTMAELRASMSLAAIYMLRMLGLFMILPVFSIYARELPDATPLSIGLALSAYGLTQAIFGIPFGMWSDKAGRKPVIAIGLIVFAAGSAVAAIADTVAGIIVGRALQGAGAIAAVVMALAADLTREEHRLKAMALIGVSIGVSFAVSMVMGPIIAGWIGVKGLFWLIGALALLGLAVLFLIVPNPTVSRFHRDTEPLPAQFLTVLGNPELLRLDFGIFALHLILTATFVALPLVLRDSVQLETAQHGLLYLPVFVLSLLTMVPFVILAEKKRKMKAVFLGFIGLIALADAGLSALNGSLLGIGLLLYGFFTGFNLLEATLPSLISKVSPPDLKGTAMGVYSTAQFLGAFVGGVAGGWIHGRFGLSAVFLFCAIVALAWWGLALGMRPPRHLSSLMIGIDAIEPNQALALSQRLLTVDGVEEAVVVAEDRVAYLKVDKRLLDRTALENILADLDVTGKSI